MGPEKTEPYNSLHFVFLYGQCPPDLTPSRYSSDVAAGDNSLPFKILTAVVMSTGNLTYGSFFPLCTCRVCSYSKAYTAEQVFPVTFESANKKTALHSKNLVRSGTDTAWFAESQPIKSLFSHLLLCYHQYCVLMQKNSQYTILA